MTSQQEPSNTVHSGGVRRVQAILVHFLSALPVGDVYIPTGRSIFSQGDVWNRLVVF